MRKSIVVIFAICSIFSCIEEYEYRSNETVFEEIMDEFYSHHLRFPTSGFDFKTQFYKEDSVNAFKRLKGFMPDSAKYTYLSYDEYYYLIDSFFRKYKKASFYMDWLYEIFNSHESIEFICNQDSIMMIDHQRHFIFSARNIESLFMKYIKGSMTSRESSDIRNILLTRNYSRVHFCSKDSIVIEFPDSLLNVILPTAHVFELGYPLFEDSVLTMPKEKEHDILLVLRYNKKDGITDLENNRITIGNSKSSQRFTQYLDSLIDMDNRIYFLQLCISPIGNTWDRVGTIEIE